MSLTKQEKIALAEAEVEVAKNMIAYSRRDLDKWLNTLEIRQEYLEAITKVSDLVVKSVNANTDVANPQEQRIAEYKQLLNELPSPAKPKTDADKGWNGALEACRAIIEARIKELE